jgi:hypothetical protein
VNGGELPMIGSGEGEADGVQEKVAISETWSNRRRAS